MGCREKFRFTGLALVSLWLFSAPCQAARIEWRHDIRRAVAEAKRTGKPLLIQVTAPWCGWCHRMFDQTYLQDQVVQQVRGGFITLRMDFDSNRDVAEKLGVRSLPATVIVSPELTILKSLSGFQSAHVLSNELCSIRVEGWTASSVLGHTRIQDTNDERFEAFASENRLTLAAAWIEEPRRAAPPPPPLARQFLRTGEAAGYFSGNYHAATDSDSAPSEFAFGANCLVTLISERRMVTGQPEFSAVYRGFQVCFASREYLQKFQSNPELYWPTLHGKCAVSLLEDHATREGRPQHGAVYRGRMWFFSSPSNMQAFIEQPAEFANEIEHRLAAASD